MNLALWIAQVLLALLFFAVGSAKALSATDAMAQAMGLSPALVRFIGVSELLGAFGLILPAATRIKPRLTALAAVGLGVIMILATLFHLSRREYPNAGETIVILAVTAFVAYGRGVRRPIAAKASRAAA